ncbi:ras GEF [Venturia nashicola]|nr:ras GEF [Venturia nashicola]
MPTYGRAAVSSSSRPSNKTSRSGTDNYQYNKREKTKSSQSYTTRPLRESVPHITTTQPATTGSTQAQRPSKSRAYSAPLVPKSDPTGPEVRNSADDASTGDDEKTAEETDEQEEAQDDDEDEEDDIADDAFFQRFDAPSSHRPEPFDAPSSHRPEPSILPVTPTVDPFIATDCPLSPSSTQMRARPDSTAEPLGSPLSPRAIPFPENDTRSQEINIVVLGSPFVGKSAFIQKAFNLQAPPTTATSSRKMSIDGSVYVVRLIELSFNELALDDEDRICWPDLVNGASMPYIDGAFTLYDVMNKESLVQMPGTLQGIYNASIPFILVACKCDFPPSHRHVDPYGVEKRAKALIGDITAFQTSQAAPDTQKRCVAVILRAIVSMRNQHFALAAARRRTNSSAVGRVSPRPPSYKHNRANSEFASSMLRSQNTEAYRTPSPGRLSTRSQSGLHLPVHSSTGISYENKPSGYDSGDFDQMSSDDAKSEETAKPSPPPEEIGFRFEQLVDKLLAQPRSKADSKFAAIFLALYRKFASPGSLLAAIVERFEALRNQQLPHVTKIASQQRQLCILEQWVGLYPGDFAYPSTRKMMEHFVQGLASDRIFAVASSEMAADLEAVEEDDDTDWAYSDRNRERAKYDSGNGNGSAISKSLSILSINDDSASLASLASTLRSNSSGRSTTSASSSQTMLSVVADAQRRAKAIVPNPRVPLTKEQWHALMDQPDELIARELTRMDFILFTSIRPRDLVRYVSLSAKQKERCRSLENVHRMIEHFNHVANWVVNFVLLRDKPKHRALMLEKFYRIARECRKLNNYNSLAAVVSGINNSSVYRLQATKEFISPDTAKDFKRLEVLMSQAKSYGPYRLAWDNTSGERIPYLPLHKRDLVSAAEGNRTFVGLEDKGKEERWVEGGVDPGLRINWKKFEIMGEVIVSMQRAQGVPYPMFKTNEEIRSLITDTEIQKDDDTLYDRSCHLEPAAGQGRRRFNWFPQGH